MAYKVDIDPQDDLVSVEFTGDVTFDCSITKCYATGFGDFELVSYNGDEYGFDPNGEYLMVFGPGIRVSLPTDVVVELEDALRTVFHIEE